jgi:hypothetical protein
MPHSLGSAGFAIFNHNPFRLDMRRWEMYCLKLLCKKQKNYRRKRFEKPPSLYWLLDAGIVLRISFKQTALMKFYKMVSPDKNKKLPVVRQRLLCIPAKTIFMKNKKYMRKTNLTGLALLLICSLSLAIAGCAGKSGTDDPNQIISNNGNMPVYVIEREIPGAGKLSPQELQSISEKSCGILKQMGSGIKWMHSYVTDDKIYCIYSASDTNALIAHAKSGGFPINRISAVHTMISPATAIKQ